MPQITQIARGALRHPVRTGRALLNVREVRFLIVGAINTAVGYATYWIAYTAWLHVYTWGYMVSMVLQYVVGILVAFNLHRRFVFKVRGHVMRDFIAFVGVNAVAIGLNVAILPLLVEAAHIHPLPAQAIALVFTTLISYFGHRFISFRRPAAAPTPSAAPPSMPASTQLDGPSGPQSLPDATR